MSLPNFHHHPDNLIYIRTTNGVYCDTPENLILDSEISYTALPDGYIERYYEPGISHLLKTDCSGIPQDLSWSIGDSYISNYDVIVANKIARLTV